MESLNLELITASSLDALLSDPLPQETRQRLLRFSLGKQDDALLPLDQITEILNVETANILPIPEMPSCVLGVYNWRGEMLWLVDLNDFIGYPPTSQRCQAVQQEPLHRWVTVIVVQANHQFVGIRVQQVNDIELHDLQQLQPTVPGLFPAGLLPLILGTLPPCCDAVLNIQAIAQSPLWKTHQEKGV